MGGGCARHPGGLGLHRALHGRILRHRAEEEVAFPWPPKPRPPSPVDLVTLGLTFQTAANAIDDKTLQRDVAAAGMKLVDFAVERF